MENPEEEIRAVVRSLCQGNPDEQRRALEQNFTTDASFVHPFCTVPHFKGRRVPVLGSISSRNVVGSIFEWYRMLSPDLVIEVDSVLYDHARDKLFLDMRQTFAIWLVPFYRARVRLVTVLDLVSDETVRLNEPLARLAGPHAAGAAGEDAKSDDEKPPSFHQDHHLGTFPPSGRRAWKIRKQEDLYQVTEFLKFTGFAPLVLGWVLFQLAATAVCVVMSLFLRLAPWAGQKEPARGGLEAEIQQIDRDAAGKASAAGDSAVLVDGVSDDDNGGEGNSKARGKAVAVDEDDSLAASGGGSGGGGGGGGGGGDSESATSEAETGTSGTRRTSATSKASSHSAPAKPWKHKKKTSR